MILRAKGFAKSEGSDGYGAFEPAPWGEAQLPRRRRNGTTLGMPPRFDGEVFIFNGRLS